MIKKIFLGFCIVILLLVGYWLLVFEGKSPDKRTAHGYVEGQINEIRLGNTLLRFPAGVPFEPTTIHKIVKGQADAIWFAFAYPEYNEKSLPSDNVQIMLKPALPEWTENIAEREKRFNEEKWQKVVQRDDLGLTEYHSVNYGGGWGYIMYVAQNLEDKTPIGNRIMYDCAGNPGGEITHCRSAYNGYLQKNKVMVTYYINGVHMRDWKEIHQKVVSLLDTIIVE